MLENPSGSSVLCKYCSVGSFSVTMLSLIGYDDMPSGEGEENDDEEQEGDGTEDENVEEDAEEQDDDDDDDDDEGILGTSMK
jgi:ABC-type Zn2+ transport system substrate-binding protein/surface adhesin